MKQSEGEAKKAFLPRELLFLLAGFAVFIVFGFAQDSPDLHVVAAGLVSCGIGVVVHELAHALGCNVVGGTVHYIQIGYRIGSQRPLRFRFLGYTWHVYSVPLSGSVRGSIYDEKHYRLRRCFFILAGPLSNLLLLAMGIYCLLYVPYSSMELSILLGWTFANATLLTMSVIPMSFRKGSVLHPNDAMLIWQALRYTPAEIKNHVQAAKFWGHADMSVTGLPLDELLAEHQSSPDNIATLWALVEKLDAEQEPRFSQFIRKLIARPELSPQQLSSFIDRYLTWQLARGPGENPEEDDQLSQHLLNLDDSNSTRGTRGSVLIDLGRTVEGKALLQEVLSKADTMIERGYSSVFLALAEKQEGNLEAARNYALAAKKADPQCPALTRVEDLLREA